MTYPVYTLLLCLSFITASSQAALTEEDLGRLLYMDDNLSLMRNRSCNSCHAVTPAQPRRDAAALPAPGFVDAENVRDGSAVSRGSLPSASGKLNAPSVGYARFSPNFHWDTLEGHYVGGQFWNGRASTLADQAKGPPLNPLEMAMPSAWAVVTRLQENPVYIAAFKRLYDVDLDALPAYRNSAKERSPPGISEAYDAMAKALAAFEKSRFFNRFTSKFDFVQAGRVQFTPEEQRGFELFNGDKALCSACHTSAPLPVPGGEVPAVFTDFTYDNLGLPPNASIPGNPEPDPGLGGRPEIAALDPAGVQLGKHKVMGLRNIAITAPYMHNGVLATLEQVVHFYNTRDTKPRQCVDNNDPGFGKTCWPTPEIAQNMNVDELGNLGLSDAEERAVVAFMLTLTDGYPESGNDPRIPPGTPSPYADVQLPPAP